MPNHSAEKFDRQDGPGQTAPPAYKTPATCREIANAWRKFSAPVAAWTLKRLVNRTDAFGHYIAVGDRKHPDRNTFTDKSGLTLAVIQRHYEARSTGDLIGLHSTVRDEAAGEGETAACWSRWVAVDIDRHGDDGNPDANMRAAKAWSDRLSGLGFSPLLTDSNGKGGFHLLAAFDAPVPTVKAHAFAEWLASDWKSLGLSEPPETYPKQAAIEAGKFGNYLRLPGRHHTRDHYSRVWDGSTESWLEGAAAVKAITKTAAASVDAIPAEAAPKPRAVKPKPTRASDLIGDAELAREALEYVKHLAGTYDTWLKTGMSLSPLGAEGLALWDAWSAYDLNSYEEGACDRKWRTFGRDGGLTLGSLFHLAKQNGWPGPAKKTTTACVPAQTVASPPALRVVSAETEEEPRGEDGADDEIVDRWPKIDRHAFYGIAGEFVRAADPQSEADPVAVLAQMLAAFGNVAGRNAYFQVSATRHHTNINVAMAGFTAIGRKGSSWDAVRFSLSSLDESWHHDRILSGLVSGEGLIHHVRDASYKTEDVKDRGRVVGQQTVLADGGVTDKRLLVIETEMGRVLKAMNRESNTLSDVLRQAWDGGTLRTLAKNAACAATDAHVSIICHVTPADIRKHLLAEDSVNGFANRFLWLAVRQSKVLPDGGDFSDPAFLAEWDPIRFRLAEALEFARVPRKMYRDRDATRIWRGIYEELSAGQSGDFGAILGRAAPYVLRLASLYALLDRSEAIRPEHLAAALALWKYAEDSARFLFGERFGNPDAEKLLTALRAAPGGLSRTLITVKVFSRHKSRKQVNALLSDLLTRGEIHRSLSRGEPGRPVELWHAGKAVSGAAN